MSTKSKVQSLLIRVLASTMVVFGGTASLLGSGGGGGDSVIAPFDLATGVIVADLNGDGRPDVALARTHIAAPPPHPGSVLVYLHSPSASDTFLGPVSYPVGSDPWRMTAADLNGDGLTDLAVASTTGNAISVLFQDVTQAGSFLAARTFDSDPAPYQVAAADMNGDGRLDMVAAVQANPPGGVSLLLQNPLLPSDFAAPVNLPIGPGSTTVATGDFNQDAKPDIVVATFNPLDASVDGVYIGLQDANVAGTFLVNKLAAGQSPSYVAVGDLNGDGLDDLVVINQVVNGQGSGITIMLQDPAQPGQFLSPVKYPMNYGARMAVVADVNADGRPDIAVAADVLNLVNESRSIVQIFLQDPNQAGHFIPAGAYPSGRAADFIAVGDINLDGTPDIVTSEGPSVLLQDPLQPGIFLPLRALY